MSVDMDGCVVVVKVCRWYVGLYEWTFVLLLWRCVCETEWLYCGCACMLTRMDGCVVVVHVYRHVWMAVLLWLCRYDDGLLEVMALHSAFHICQLQIGMAAPVRLGQASTVKVRRAHGAASP